MYRYKPSIPVKYDMQGYIYFYSKRYRKLPAGERENIRAACRAACSGMAADYSEAVLEFVTTNKGAVGICSRHYLSESTLERAVRRYYEIMAARLR